jgi:pimeloyl-ACP methyl ester carboxylesterase
MRDYASLLHKFVDALELEHFALIAHDSGGGAARLLAAELGQRVRCMILQNTEVPTHMSFQLRLFKWASYSAAFSSALMRALCSNGALRRSELGFGSCFGDRALIDGEFLEACVRPLLTGAPGHQAIMRHVDLGWTARLTGAHARITAPIHLFWGEADKYFPLQYARQMAKDFANPGELRVIPRAKLYVHEEAPAELAEFSLRHLAAAFPEASASTRARVALS